ncbi:hypothetical protein HDU96_003310 [Phlyctochytrium bullatum]|nr:hypothetical protein HDU96_003310 [Phlyctochytrium bullatum]
MSFRVFPRLHAASTRAMMRRGFASSSGGHHETSSLGLPAGVSLNSVLLAGAGLVAVGSVLISAKQASVARQDAENFSREKERLRYHPALDPDTFLPFRLLSVDPLTPNTSRFRFALPEGATELGMPTASCVVTKVVKGTKKDGTTPNVVVRAYTPVEDPGEGRTGTFDLVVKRYPTGVVSSYIHSLKPGDQLEIKGPIMKYPYKPNKEGHVGLIAGGSGLTPMLQIIQRVLSNPEDKTKVTFLFANVTEEDIIMRDYLDGLAKKHPKQFKVYYALSSPPPKWTQGSGFVSEKMIQDLMPKPGAGKVFVCGPEPMMAHVSGSKAKDYTQGEVGGLLKKLGYSKDDVFKF